VGDQPLRRQLGQAAAQRALHYAMPAFAERVDRLVEGVTSRSGAERTLAS
jgi:hypothetical protein